MPRPKKQQQAEAQAPVEPGALLPRVHQCRCWLALAAYGQMCHSGLQVPAPPPPVAPAARRPPAVPSLSAAAEALPAADDATGGAPGKKKRNNNPGIRVQVGWLGCVAVGARCQLLPIAASNCCGGGAVRPLYLTADALLPLLPLPSSLPGRASV